MQVDMMSDTLKEEFCRGGVVEVYPWLMDHGFDVRDLVIHEQLAMLERAVDSNRNQNVGADFFVHTP